MVHDIKPVTKYVNYLTRSINNIESRSPQMFTIGNAVAIPIYCSQHTNNVFIRVFYVHYVEFAVRVSGVLLTFTALTMIISFIIKRPHSRYSVCVCSVTVEFNGFPRGFTGPGTSVEVVEFYSNRVRLGSKTIKMYQNRITN